MALKIYVTFRPLEKGKIFSHTSISKNENALHRISMSMKRTHPMSFHQTKKKLIVSEITLLTAKTILFNVIKQKITLEYRLYQSIFLTTAKFNSLMMALNGIQRELINYATTYHLVNNFFCFLFNRRCAIVSGSWRMNGRILQCFSA